MSRRGAAGPPITLFSFQDIVTSVTGIVILVTLLLSVELLHRKPRVTELDPQYVPAAPEKPASTVDLEAEVRELQARLDSRIKTVKAMAYATTGQLNRETEDLRRQEQQLSNEIRQLEAAKSRIKEELKTLIAADAARAEQELTDVQAKVKAVEQEIGELKDRTRLVYHLAPELRKTPWLVDIAAERVLVLGFQSRNAVQEFREGTESAMVAGFRQWALVRPRDREYFVLLVRPSGVRLFDAIRSSLESRQFDVGFDLIDSRQTVVPSFASED